MLLSYLGKIGDRKRQKPKIFLKCGCKVGAGCGSACLPFGVSACVGVQALDAILLTLAKMDGIPSFCPLSRFALGALIANVALFRVLRGFLGGFIGQMYICMV